MDIALYIIIFFEKILEEMRGIGWGKDGNYYFYRISSL